MNLMMHWATVLATIIGCARGDTASVLVIPVCPEDSPVCFDYGIIKSEHNGNFASYFDGVHEVASEFFKASSDGKFDISTTIAPVIRLEGYTSDECGEPNALGNSDSIERRAQAAALQDGYDWQEFTYNAIALSLCQEFRWAGNSRVGRAGMVLNLDARTYDPFYVHELGHNLGLSHDSCVENESRGSIAWKDEDEIVLEYCNPFTSLGSGEAVDAGEFLVAGKHFLNWIDDDHIKSVEPYHFLATGNDDVVDCITAEACRYHLGVVDVGELDLSMESEFAGIRIKAEVEDRWFYLEHRHLSTGKSAVLIYWVTFDGFRDRPSKTILVDSTPFTSSWEDAALATGSSVTLDLAGGENSRQYLLKVSVEATISQRADEVTVTLQAVVDDEYLPGTLPGYEPSMAPSSHGDIRLQSAVPSRKPTSAPRSMPTTRESTLYPTIRPTASATHPLPTTEFPSYPTTRAPTRHPSRPPTTQTPTLRPIPPKTLAPISRPTSASPNYPPTHRPTSSLPSQTPTSQEPSPQPYSLPTYAPTPRPSFRPTLIPTPLKSYSPTTKMPTSSRPTKKPSAFPTYQPSRAPSRQESDEHSPSPKPVFEATDQPTFEASPQRQTPTQDSATGRGHRRMDPTTCPTARYFPTSHSPTNFGTSSAAPRPTTLRPTIRPSPNPSSSRPTNQPELKTKAPTLPPSPVPELLPIPTGANGLNVSSRATTSPSLAQSVDYISTDDEQHPNATIDSDQVDDGDQDSTVTVVAVFIAALVCIAVLSLTVAVTRNRALAFDCTGRAIHPHLSAVDSKLPFKAVDEDEEDAQSEQSDIHLIYSDTLVAGTQKCSAP